MSNKNLKPYHKYLRFTGIAMQMGVTIYLGSILGEWLDSKYVNEHQMYTKICAVVAVVVSTYSIIKQVINISKDK